MTGYMTRVRSLSWRVGDDSWRFDWTGCPRNGKRIDSCCLVDLHNITKLLAAEQYRSKPAVTSNVQHKPLATIEVYRRFLARPLYVESNRMPPCTPVAGF